MSSWAAWFNSAFFFALCGVGVLANGVQFDGGGPSTQPATTTEEVLAPSPEVLRLLSSEDPENHLEGFAAWYQWRGGLPTEKKRAANRFLARERWLTALGDEVLYDMTGRRRLSAYKLLRRISSPRVFPYFLWGIREGPISPPAFPGVGFLRSLLNQSQYVKRFFRMHGDPTVIEFLPDDFDWRRARRKIERRWADREPPERNWEPFKVEDFVSDLAHAEASRRRLAIRALTTNLRSGGIVEDHRYRPLLSDRDAGVRLIAAEALTLTSCPAARGALKRIVDDDEAPLALRRMCLYAVVHCHKARRWTAEWMIDSVPTWPAALDETVQACLVQLCPGLKPDKRSYVSFLRRVLERNESSRVRRVVEGALAALPS